MAINYYCTVGSIVICIVGSHPPSQISAKQEVPCLFQKCKVKFEVVALQPSYISSYKFGDAVSESNDICLEVKAQA